MRTEDTERFAQAMTAIAEIHGKPISEQAMSLWWALLERYDIAEVERALHDCLRDPDRGQYMPRPADVVRSIEGAGADRALVAWGKVLDATRRVGAYRSVAFDDAAIHAAIADMGGWPEICRAQVNEMPFLQKRFCDLYRVGDHGSALGHLPGLFEQDNRLRGHDVEPPVLVGDPSKAGALVLGGGRSRTSYTLVAGTALAAVGRIGGAT